MKLFGSAVLRRAITAAGVGAMLQRAFVFAVAVVMTLAGCANPLDPSSAPSVQYPQQQVFDMFEAALRYRLATAPLWPHATCYVYLENTDGPIERFAKRFPEYRMVVRRNSPGNSPPVPWFYMRLGKTTRDYAWITIDYRGGGLAYTLCRQGDKWIVTHAEEPVLI
jgi:hypothetical protein